VGRKTKVPEIDLLDLLRTKDKPFPLREIADYFEAAKDTARKAIGRARKNGHPIIPTTQGEWYIVQIKTPEQFNAVAAAIGWHSRMIHELGRIGKLARDVQDTAPARIEKQAEQLKASGE
jgi:hypothetical protein